MAFDKNWYVLLNDVWRGNRVWNLLRDGYWVRFGEWYSYWNLVGYLDWVLDWVWDALLDGVWYWFVDWHWVWFGYMDWIWTIYWIGDWYLHWVWDLLLYWNWVWVGYWYLDLKSNLNKFKICMLPVMYCISGAHCTE